MIQIGAFSKLSRVSIRMLRHYHDIGLFSPAAIDPVTGYRYYEAGQLERIFRIQSLKEMGFSLALIKEILDTYQDKDALKRYLELHLQHLRQESAVLEEEKRHIQAAITQLEKEEQPMQYPVTCKEISEMTVMALRKTIPTYGDEGIIWNEMGEELQKAKRELPPAAFSIAVFYDEGFQEHDVDVEVRLPIQKAMPDAGKVTCKKVPAVTVASAVLKGDYSKIMEVSQSVAQWVTNNGYEFSGPMFNIYHVSPGCDPDPKNWVTEICFPVKKK